MLVGNDDVDHGEEFGWQGSGRCRVENGGRASIASGDE